MGYILFFFYLFSMAEEAVPGATDEAAPPAQNGTASQYAHTVPYYTHYAHKYLRLPVNTNTKIHK